MNNEKTTEAAKQRQPDPRRWALLADTMPEPAPQPDPFSPAKPIPPCPPEPERGDLVRVRRPDGDVDLVQVVSAWTAARGGARMLTVIRRPYGVFSFDVRADAVLADDEPDVRHDAIECGPDCEVHRAERAAAGRSEL